MYAMNPAASEGDVEAVNYLLEEKWETAPLNFYATELSK